MLEEGLVLKNSTFQKITVEEFLERSVNKNTLRKDPTWDEHFCTWGSFHQQIRSGE